MKTTPAQRMMITGARLSAWCAALALGGALQAATAPRVNDSATPPARVRADRDGAKLKHADHSFLEKAARSSMDEVEISRVATERTSNPEVKRFAEMMIADHDGANQELMRLASLKEVNLPAKEALAEKWSKRDAKNFDRDYIDKMVSDHEDTVKLFEKQAKDGEDADVVAFARKHLPTLQTHLQQALDLKRALKERR